MGSEELVEQVRKKFERLSGVLDERGRRIWASVEAEALGQAHLNASLNKVKLVEQTDFAEMLSQTPITLMDVEKMLFTDWVQA